MIPRADGPYLTMSVQQHTLNTNVKNVPKTILIYRAAPASSDNTIGSVGEKQNAIDGKKRIV